MEQSVNVCGALRLRNYVRQGTSYFAFERPNTVYACQVCMTSGSSDIGLGTSVNRVEKSDLDPAEDNPGRIFWFRASR
jgi:hypothetical protein